MFYNQWHILFVMYNVQFFVFHLCLFSSIKGFQVHEIDR
jgi:hypothetical protein